MADELREINSLPFSSNEKQVTAPNPQFESFEIVLVDIQRAATEGKIHCVKKHLEPGIDLKYVAISYRWGELPEQLVVTPDYNAHITSFHIRDFIRVCQAISKEVDFCTMQYVWVDAICVDQVNETRRRETIYHMSEIYEYANWILVVPDLHLGYLKNDLNYEVIQWLLFNTEYAYQVIMNNGDRVEEMDNQYMDKMKVPKHLRCHLKSQLTGPEDQEKQEKRLFVELIHLEEEQNEDNGPLDSWHAFSLMNKWQRHLAFRRQHLERALKFLRHQIKDWSQRTWVISEYYIASKKNNGVLKFWFASLAGHLYNRPGGTVSTFKFFETDTTRFPTLINPNQTLPVTNDSLLLGTNFRSTSHIQISANSFVDMLLRSNASKNSDRFYAILPLSEEFRHHIEDRDTINNWKITDMVSVRMRFRQWLTTKENIGLLYTSRDHEYSFLLPSFDSIGIMDVYKHKSHLIDQYIMFGSRMQYNYNQRSQNQPALVIKDKIDDSNILVPDDDRSCIQLRYSIHLFPEFYYAKTIAFKRDISHIICARIWQDLGLDLLVDPLSWLQVPMFIKCDNARPKKNTIECFDPYPSKSVDIYSLSRPLNLIGSRSKNVWIVIKPESGFLTTEYVRSLDDWVWCERGDNGLRIY